MSILYPLPRMMLACIPLLLAVLLSWPPAWAGAEPVKKSRTGICHSVESPYYDRVKRFEAYQSVKDCLATGARLPRGTAAPQSKPTASAGPDHTGGDYDRDAYGGWGDEDRDCQNTRAELLISQSTGPVRFADKRECRVVAGRWISLFTGDVIYDASRVDIDHVVALGYSWPRGGKDWTVAKREQFANDHRNLVVMERELNRSKGAKGLTEWLPPQGQCQYIARFVRIVRLYELTLGQREERGINNLLAKCRK